MASFSREELVPGNNGCVLQATGHRRKVVARGFGPQNLNLLHLHVPARSHGGDFPSIFSPARQSRSSRLMTKSRF